VEIKNPEVTSRKTIAAPRTRANLHTWYPEVKSPP
jgi:hypothetical protein